MNLGPRIDVELQAFDGTVRDLGQEGSQLGIDRLGREHVLENPVVAGDLAQQGEIGVVADGKDIRPRVLRGVFPLACIVGGDLAPDDGRPAIGAAIGQRHDRAVRQLALGERAGERLVQVGAASQRTPANEVQGALNIGRRRRHRLRLKLDTS